MIFNSDIYSLCKIVKCREFCKINNCINCLNIDKSNDWLILTLAGFFFMKYKTGSESLPGYVWKGIFFSSPSGQGLKC